MTDARMQYKVASGDEANVVPVVLVGSVDENGVPQMASLGSSPVDLSGYLTKGDASTIYAPMASLSGYATTAQLTAVQNSIAAAIQTAFMGFEGSVSGDVSAAGKSISLSLPDGGVRATLSYTAAGAANMTFAAITGAVFPVDIRRNSIWGGSAVETFTLDSGTLTTDGTVADDTIYTSSQDSSAYFIRANGNTYFLTVWASGAGARAFMGYHKMV